MFSKTLITLQIDEFSMSYWKKKNMQDHGITPKRDVYLILS